MKKVSVFFVAMCITLSATVAQTAYEKRIEQIEKEAAQKLGYSQMNDIVVLMLMDGAIDALYGYNTKKARVAVWMAEEMEKAEKLKTPEEIRREKQKAEEEKKKAALAEEKRKKEEEERRKKEAYERTDFRIIEKDIKFAFEKWQQKGEFEKQANYEERLKTQSLHKFPEICGKAIKNRIIKEIYNPFLWADRIRTESLVYNSEDEFFDVSFALKNGIEWRSKINIPIENAENFKKNWDRLKSEINDYDWCFIENTLYPKLVTMVHRDNDKKEIEKYEFRSLLSKPQEITFSFDEFGIENPYLKGFVFNYSTARIQAAERDSLEYANYVQKLDSVFVAYNQQLLQNPYNINGEKMTDYKKMKRDGDRKENYEISFQDIEHNFESLNRNFGGNLKSQNPEEYFKIYYSLNPDKKAEMDEIYKKCWCEFKSRLDFDLNFYSNMLLIPGRCKCRDAHSYIGYFSGEAEFDSFFKQGNEIFNQEVEKREEKRKAKQEVEKFAIQPKDPIDLTSNNWSKREDKLRTYLYQNKNKPYYSELIDIAIENNKELNKEWSKNGQYFQDKTEFYEVYISENYKHILKAKKKKK